jgi:hypothetical protein
LVPTFFVGSRWTPFASRLLLCGRLLPRLFFFGLRVGMVHLLLRRVELVRHGAFAMGASSAVLFEMAHNIVVVPGYGMAVAQAQHAVAELGNVLRERGVDEKCMMLFGDTKDSLSSSPR